MPNKTLQRTAATVIDLPGHEVTEVAAAAELGRSANGFSKLLFLASVMKYDFRVQPTGEGADRFCSWLEQETINSLRRSYGDPESTKSAVFLYVNRAYEAHMPESLIGETFGKCLVRAGFAEHEEDQAFQWLEFFGQLAAKVHG